MEYKTYWKVEELPDNGVVFARMADDVMEPEDWNTYKLTIKDGIVIQMTVQVKGCYAGIPKLGAMTKAELVEWQYDSDPSYSPGYFQELAIPKVIENEDGSASFNTKLVGMGF